VEWSGVYKVHRHTHTWGHGYNSP